MRNNLVVSLELKLKKEKTQSFKKTKMNPAHSLMNPRETPLLSSPSTRAIVLKKLIISTAKQRKSLDGLLVYI